MTLSTELAGQRFRLAQGGHFTFIVDRVRQAHLLFHAEGEERHARRLEVRTLIERFDRKELLWLKPDGTPVAPKQWRVLRRALTALDGPAKAGPPVVSSPPGIDAEQVGTVVQKASPSRNSATLGDYSTTIITKPKAAEDASQRSWWLDFASPESPRESFDAAVAARQGRMVQGWGKRQKQA